MAASVGYLPVWGPFIQLKREMLKPEGLIIFMKPFPIASDPISGTQIPLLSTWEAKIYSSWLVFILASSRHQIFPLLSWKINVFSPSNDNPQLACGFHSQIPETDSQSVLYLVSHTSRSSNTTTRIIFLGHQFFNHVDPFLRTLHLLKIKLKIPRLSYSSPVLTPQKMPPAADLRQSLVFTRLGGSLGISTCGLNGRGSRIG